MAVTYEWVIDGVNAYPVQDKRVNQVHTIHWRLNGMDGYSATQYGSVAVQYDPESDYIPYEDLTKDDMVAWVLSSLGDEEVTRLKDAVAAEINARKNPTSVSLELPWNN